MKSIRKSWRTYEEDFRATPSHQDDFHRQLLQNSADATSTLSNSSGETLFHAIAKITLHIRKKHPFYFDDVRELGLVFREDNDIDHEWKKETPSPSKIHERINEFLKKWRPVNYKGWFLINAQVENQLENLIHQVTRGCLSSIPKGMGTNRNENLHLHRWRWLSDGETWCLYHFEFALFLMNLHWIDAELRVTWWECMVEVIS